MNAFTFITTNEGKVKELKDKTSASSIKIKHLNASYPELQANTLFDIVKYALVYCREFFAPPFIIEDSGLFIEDLNDFPGPYSAYVYKTLRCDGILKLVPEGAACRFESILGVFDGNYTLFKGTVTGTIVHPRGTMGFGFDPIFEYGGRTFAEMSLQEKNLVSHRSRSMSKFIQWAQKLYKS